MALHGLTSKVGSILKRALGNSGNGEIHALRMEITDLRAQLHSMEQARTNSVMQEIEILRNEMQENIAAIHRLEVLTLSRRIQMLNDFGKALPPTVPGRTRRSSKPKGYSFGIITDGRRKEKVFKLVNTIRAQPLTSDDCEIIIAGNVEGLGLPEDINKIPMAEAAAEGRLGAMRNALAKAASFNKFVSLDDDLLLHPGWVDAVEDVQGDFDVATGIIVNPDLSRYCDWVSIIENYTFLRPYQETFDRCQYMTGGYGIYKDFIFLEHSWNDTLGFYEGEDVSFSRKLFDSGYQLKFIPRAIVMHDDERYRQKGYGVIRLKSAEQMADAGSICTKLEKLCPQTLS